MTRVSQLVVVLSPLFVGGCEQPSEGDSGSGHPTSGGQQQPTRELRSRTELADENEIAPNGQTGARILAAVPESVHTTLNWNFSENYTGVEVEVPGATGPSAVLDLTFALPSEPQFFFEDWTVVYPDDYNVDLEVICLDQITTTVDATLMTEDGTVSLELTGLVIRLEADNPGTGFVAKPLIYETAAMQTPEVNFLKPEVLPASVDKTIVMAFDFDGMSVHGNLIVRAEGSAAAHEHAVAKW